MGRAALIKRQRGQTRTWRTRHPWTGNRETFLVRARREALRAPDGYEAVRAELARLEDRRSAENLEAEYRSSLDDQETLRQRLDVEQNLRIEALADAEAANEELAVLQRQLDTYRRVLDKSGAREHLWCEACAEAEEVPLTADSCADAAVQAQLHLANVVIPDTALAHVAAFDAQVESRAWAQTSWRGFRALHSYAADSRRYKGFWDWCEHSGSPYAWPASPKKLAMSESEGVINSRELRAARTFPISSEAEATGRIVMVAHLKIAEGGGPMAPRIYFHDDTKGPTGKVHVGYFGPHKHVPNQSTD